MVKEDKTKIITKVIRLRKGQKKPKRIPKRYIFNFDIFKGGEKNE